MRDMTNAGTGRTCGIIVAAGRSERMGGTDKMFTELSGRALLVWTLAAFKRSQDIDDIVIAGAEHSLERLSSLVREWRFDSKVSAIVAGGATRQESVRNALEEVGEATIVAVHDGARPMVTPELIEAGVKLARKRGAAVCAVQARDTVKQVEGDPPIVVRTIARDTIWLAQTPQCFRTELLRAAHQAGDATATDDALLVEATGVPVAIYEGSWSNLKVTTREDLIVAEAIMRARLSDEGD
jgi:2-C-methyl-D-erythritol 4-phosphate cytidylyltransferase